MEETGGFEKDGALKRFPSGRVMNQKIPAELDSLRRDVRRGSSPQDCCPDVVDNKGIYFFRSNFNLEIDLPASPVGFNHGSFKYSHGVILEQMR